jgi:hypothetical protein
MSDVMMSDVFCLAIPLRYWRKKSDIKSAVSYEL